MENAGEGSAQRLLARALERNTLRLLGHLTFEFKKRRQLFIRTDNETLSVAAMRDPILPLCSLRGNNFCSHRAAVPANESP